VRKKFSGLEKAANFLDSLVELEGLRNRSHVSWQENPQTLICYTGIHWRLTTNLSIECDINTMRMPMFTRRPKRLPRRKRPMICPRREDPRGSEA